MAMSHLNSVVHHFRRTALLADVADRTDGQLLRGFVSHREEAAFEALVRRLGPMVWRVCRRMLSNHDDVEDAFQATFLVLARKAGSIVPMDMVGNWLYGVARQTALRARAIASKRRGHERQVAKMPDQAAADKSAGNELHQVLDLELSRLPANYRIALLLCDLEGKTRKEAARQLGWVEGTMASRLARARSLLAKRLARHGLNVSGATLAATLAATLTQNAAANVPAAVISATIKAAALSTVGQAGTALI
jgi:RNA polymerase sigma factor (sigma-70 family)